MKIRHFVAAGAFACAAALPFAAADDATPKDQLAAFCVEEGQPAEECACYAGFAADNLSEREMLGLLTLTDPAKRTDVATGIQALLEAGLSLDEIADVYARVVDLEADAEAACTVPKNGAG